MAFSKFFISLSRSNIYYSVNFLVPSNGTEGVVFGARVRDGGCNISYSPGVFIYINIKSRLILVTGNFCKMSIRLII